MSAQLSSLTDTTLTSIRTSIGTLLNPTANSSVLVLASNGTDTGAYLVTDTNGDGQVANTEIRLLGVFTGNADITVGDIALG
ncbi:hypothetical protein CCP1ISM_6320001 [Azospirillaceae bacterium]